MKKIMESISILLMIELFAFLPIWAISHGEKISVIGPEIWFNLLLLSVLIFIEIQPDIKKEDKDSKKEENEQKNIIEKRICRLCDKEADFCIEEDDFCSYHVYKNALEAYPKMGFFREWQLSCWLKDKKIKK